MTRDKNILSVVLLFTQFNSLLSQANLCEILRDQDPCINTYGPNYDRTKFVCAVDPANDSKVICKKRRENLSKSSNSTNTNEEINLIPNWNPETCFDCETDHDCGINFVCITLAAIYGDERCTNGIKRCDCREGFENIDRVCQSILTKIDGNINSTILMEKTTIAPSNYDKNTTIDWTTNSRNTILAATTTVKLKTTTTHELQNPNFSVTSRNTTPQKIMPQSTTPSIATSTATIALTSLANRMTTKRIKIITFSIGSVLFMLIVFGYVGSRSDLGV